VSKRVPKRGEKWVYLDPIPPCTTVDLVYSTERSIAASAYEAYWDFNLNSIFDPDQTFSGSQPTYFDEWSGLYTRYRVTEALVEVWCSNITAGHLKMACAATADSPSGFITEDIAGWRTAKEESFNNGGPLAYTKSHIKCHKAFGINREAYLADSVYGSNVTTSPSKIVYFALRAKTYGSTDTVFFSVRIRFRVRFEGPEAKTLSATRLLPEAAKAANERPPQNGKCTRVTERLVEHSVECAEYYASHSCRLCEGRQATPGSKTGRGHDPAYSGHSS
jgi:hypothetical protein